MDLTSIASSLSSGLQQPSGLGSQLTSGVSQLLNSQDLASVGSQLAETLTNVASQQQQTVGNAASALNSVVSGVLNVGNQGGSQLLNTAQQVLGQLPAISNLQSTGTGMLSSALNANLPQIISSFLTGPS